MRAFYFTFRTYHPMHGYVQQVIATSREKSVLTMNKLYGNGWEFCFTQTEMEERLRAGDFCQCAPLSPVYAK